MHSVHEGSITDKYMKHALYWILLGCSVFFQASGCSMVECAAGGVQEIMQLGSQALKLGGRGRLAGRREGCTCSLGSVNPGQG